VIALWYMPSYTGSTISFDPNKTTTDASLIDAINDAHARGMGVMLKPHLVPTDGYNATDVVPSDPAAFFASYAEFINHYARIAQDHGVELFCIGCELDGIANSKYSSYWSTVIGGIRAIYGGPLTYASSQYGYTQVPFWGLLDYAGIDAYFSVSGMVTPTVADAVSGWSTLWYNQQPGWLPQIETWQATINKPVIFTEIGYRSNDYAGRGIDNNVYNPQGQANCYEATLQAFSNKPWFKGMFWWEWRPDPNAGGKNDIWYTPQNKPAQSVLTANWLPCAETEILERVSAGHLS
jgi:hypothetical protein